MTAPLSTAPRNDLRRHPWFERGKHGGGMAAFDDASVNGWSPAKRALWAGWLAGRHWATLARFIAVGWSPSEQAWLFPDGRAGDAAVRAALGGLDREASFVLTHPAHAKALLRVAPDGYALAHPMRRAVHVQSHELLEALLQAGASPCLPCRGLPGNPLNHAAAIGWADGVRRLVAAGADPNGRDSEGRSPLQVAAEQGRCASVRELVACGARLTEPGRRKRPLLLEITQQRSGAGGKTLRRTVDTLLELGAPVELPPGRRGWRTQAGWARRPELEALARVAAAVLLERDLPGASAGRANGRL